MEVTSIIKAIKNSHPFMEDIFTLGGCWRFHLILKEIWPQAIPYCNHDRDHVITEINGRLYDINGDVTHEHHRDDLHALPDTDVVDVESFEHWGPSDHKRDELFEINEKIYRRTLDRWNKFSGR